MSEARVAGEARAGVDSAPRLRRSARVLVFDRGSGDVLLIRFEVTAEGRPFVFWVTPGGEIEGVEGEREAAERELFEETGVRAALHGPVHRESGGEYVHLGERVRNDDVFFACETDRGQPRLLGITAEEVGLMREVRWWTHGELLATEDRVYPTRLRELAPDFWTELKIRMTRPAPSQNPG